ncbi:SDR family NAD(P)-dependent oxidoreductase [Comamonas aquatica]|jgi:3-oxoacyl-[acyl-carrier protein] reductase|uniref:SDR family NAD(P)-dependent oxidoreductase n=1 Tax=Comamonas aquatica TaxID=225991 RepID=UPI0005A83455|nr:SDR family NAD(P)-dependent oxidoreductase [Comamonas aquatica]ANY60808.1 3-oxoacyl-ACP reductase [Comamonas aquatica]
MSTHPQLLKGKIAVITGASRGIGFATAQTFSQAGAHIVLMGRSMATLEQACAQIRTSQDDAQVQAITCNVADPHSVRDAFQAVFRIHQKLHILVANAGVLDSALIGMVTPQQIASNFGTNTFGTLYCAQYASRLIARSGGGAIINFSSIMGHYGEVGQAVYSGSKAAIIGITKSLAKELVPQNIRVNAIAPGFIDTDMARSISPEKFAERLASIKMGRIGTPAEVANVALFLASDMASYVTGQVIGVDGGMAI